MAYKTLADMSMEASSTIDRAVIDTFRASSPIANMMPFVNTPTGTYKFYRKATGMPVAFRKYNEEYTANKFLKFESYVSTKMFGGTTKVERVLQEESEAAGNNLMAEDSVEQIESNARYFNKMFFDGDTSSDDAQFNGVNKYCVNTSGNFTNLIYANTSSAGGILSVEKMDDCLTAHNGGPAVWLMPRTMKVQLSQLQRAEGLQISTNINDFGMPVMYYAGIPIVEVGTDENNDEILDFDETVGSDSDCASIYLVSFDMQGVHGIQNKPMSALPIKEPDADNDYWVYGSEWKAATAVKKENAIVRLGGIKQA